MSDTSCHRYPVTRHWSRRDWLRTTGGGMGAIALQAMLAGRSTAAVPGLPGLPHTPPRAKRIISLFMTGGISQFESFDHKPILTERHGLELPASIRGNRPLLGMSAQQSSARTTRPIFNFAQHGQSGHWFSELFPHLSQMADQMTFIRSMQSTAVNHDPALTYLQTGAQLPGRPCLGAWLGYGLGTENENLPAYVTMISKRPVDQPLSARMWDSGFLPLKHAGVLFRSGNEPVLYLKDPQGVSREASREMVDSLAALQRLSAEEYGATAVDARISQYEMASRMQLSVPEVTDLSKEPESVKSLYGPDVNTPGTFASNCLLARRMSEQGVRMVQLFHPGWDHHGSLGTSFPVGAKEIDQACAGLLRDLAQRDMLKDTLVIFASEFGRTCYAQGNIPKTPEKYGREHHRDAFTAWMAGGGIKPGISHGLTDEFGYQVVQDPVSADDLHATILHLMGINHEKLTHRFQGREFRLTNVAGKLIQPILA